MRFRTQHWLSIAGVKYSLSFYTQHDHVLLKAKTCTCNWNLYRKNKSCFRPIYCCFIVLYAYPTVLLYALQLRTFANIPRTAYGALAIILATKECSCIVTAKRAVKCLQFTVEIVEFFKCCWLSNRSAFRKFCDIHNLLHNTGGQGLWKNLTFIAWNNSW